MFKDSLKVWLSSGPSHELSPPLCPGAEPAPHPHFCSSSTSQPSLQTFLCLRRPKFSLAPPPRSWNNLLRVVCTCKRLTLGACTLYEHLSTSCVHFDYSFLL